MKKFIALLLMTAMIAALAFFCGCGKIEAEAPLDREHENESFEIGTSENKEEKSSDFDEYQGYEVVYNIPKGWIKVGEQAYENNDIINLTYAPSGEGYIENYFYVCTATNTNNTFSSQEDMCDYLLYWLPEPYEDGNGSETLTQLSIEDYDCAVPAKSATYKYVCDGVIVNYQYYVFLLSEDSVFMIIYYHDVSSDEEYYEEFEKIIDSLKFNDFSYIIYENEISGENSFTNEFGTPTTVCAHSGCTNYIASSGDTNCCTTHSRNCGNCGKYIDEDALFCMSCLSGN